jgi:hypothetical protein
VAGICLAVFVGVDRHAVFVLYELCMLESLSATADSGVCVYLHGFAPEWYVFGCF